MAEARVGLYLRLSRDDEGGSRESMSITNQRRFLTQYIQELGWSAVDVYIDDGYTGTNFDRPDFQRLLKDVEAKRINTVVTKDLSRLGRDQIMTLYYLQVYFPSKRVRYIAVNEGIDTDRGMTGGIATPFLAAANDFYTADISRKVRTALDSRKQAGLFIGAAPPLGYQKDPQQKGHLIPDVETAPIVQAIFQDYLAHGSVMGVVKRLTEAGVATPASWKKNARTQTRFPGTWSDTMVRRILTNPTYAGHLTQNRRRKVSYKATCYETLPADAWITVPDTHLPLVSQAAFNQAQALLQARTYTPRKGGGHLLTGLAFCADCGSPMTYVRESPTRTYMVCQGYRKGGRLKLCSSHCAREDLVIASIQGQLRRLAAEVDGDAMERPQLQENGKQPLQRRLEGLERQLEGCKRVGGSLYQDKANGVLTQEEFTELFQANRVRRGTLEGQIALCRSQLEEEPDMGTWREQVERLLRFETLDRGIVGALVEKVLIHGDKRIEILFRFRRPGGRCGD